jgi:hypothetical protein
MRTYNGPQNGWEGNEHGQDIHTIELLTLLERTDREGRLQVGEVARGGSQEPTRGQPKWFVDHDWMRYVTNPNLC